MENREYMFLDRESSQTQQPSGSGLQSSQSQNSQATPTVGRKRKRTTRASNAQIDALLAALEARPFLATRRFTGLQSRENFDSAWKDLAAELNDISNGATKTPEQWTTVWRDLKSRSSTKAAKLRREKGQTGNQNINVPELNEIEKRAISIIGADYTFGTACPDSMPTPNPEDDTIELQVQESHVPDHYEYVSLPPSPQPSTSQTTIAPNNSQSRPVDETVTPNVADANNDATRTQTRSRRSRNLNPRRTIGDQLTAARNDFLAVAQANAEAMRTMANAAQLNAEANKMHAEAAIIFAKAVEKMADVFKNK